MLVSKEIIHIAGSTFVVNFYQKNTRNFSYRITGNKITISIPQIYKDPAVIEKHKQEWLQHSIDRILADPKLQNKEPIWQFDHFSILGQLYTIERIDLATKCKFDRARNTFQLPRHLDELSWKKYIIKTICKELQAELTNRITGINAVTVNKPILSVAIKDQTSRWGSCSSRGDITISAMTLLTPLWVLDYVIVHELCHLLHHDHSIAFWREVEKYYPQFRSSKNYLKNHAMVFSI